MLKDSLLCCHDSSIYNFLKMTVISSKEFSNLYNLINY